MDIIVSNETLKNILGTKNAPLIVDTRPFSEYLKGHIPTAVNIDLFQFHWLDSSKIGIRQFEIQSRKLLSNIGIRSRVPTIFYDHISGMSAARGVWLLHYFGDKKASMLDGGFEKWKYNNYPIETITNSFKHSTYIGRPNRKIIAGSSEVLSSLREQEVVLIDARTKEEYDGIHIRASRPGHIPNAINIDWEQNILKGQFKSPSKLSKVYSSISKKSPIITYCQGGFRAANTYVALKLAGYKNVKMYLGSWGEWGNNYNFPVESSTIQKD
ncbi:MAG: sulfurtransferase [Nitrososphaeraceae archaeon]